MYDTFYRSQKEAFLQVRNRLCPSNNPVQALFVRFNVPQTFLADDFSFAKLAMRVAVRLTRKHYTLSTMDKSVNLASFMASW